jgi:type III restriction enzyme
MSSTIHQLIVNSPFVEPAKHWHYDRASRSFSLEDGRRPAGYIKATEHSRAFDDPGVFVELPLVNQIRPRVKAWREAGYPGVTGITKRLLEHWYDREARPFPFFFCQLEAIETLIWLVEAPAAEKQGITIPGDGGPFSRLCSKMATGSGKTIVMTMLIAWQVLNKVTYSQDKRFSKHIFVVAPGLTVRKRLQVLLPETIENYYREFRVIPGGLMDKLRLGKVLVRNWHTLNWETDEQLAKKKGVDKRGAKSDEAYVREVLGEIAGSRNIVVINDEAHHAWRAPSGIKIPGVSREDVDEATKWVGGLDRIHKARGIQTCFDFSATPFVPSGKQSTDEALFGWIASDFGLNDAIESGLVKTPRVVVRDDALPNVKTYKSKLYHIYADPEVKTDLNRRAEEQEPLPDLVVNGYYLLGKDWLEAANAWKSAKHRVPPVMITVANRVETAARVKYAFDHGRIRIEELCVPEKTLHIDSKVLDEAESAEEPVFMGVGELSGRETDEGAGDEEGGGDDAPKRKLTRKEQAEYLRLQVDTVGKLGQPGEPIQNVISVGMLSEGWDAKTVTHIMGLRAFSSQLLCEQVVGRGLRRTSYEMQPGKDLFEPEYVNIFGVPFTFLPHEGGDGAPPPPPTPKCEIKPVPEKAEFALSWPNVLRVDHVLRPTLTLELGQVPTLELDASKTAMTADIAALVEGKPNLATCTEIDLAKLGQRFRTQKIVFETAIEVFDQMKPNWRGNREYLLAQVIGLVEKFINSQRIVIQPVLFERDDLRRRILLTLNMRKLVHHIWKAIRFGNSESVVPVFDSERPIRSTGDMRPWYTGRPCEPVKRSHINLCVYDSTWEANEAYILDRDKHVDRWVKNDHLGFEILYTFDGALHKFRPDFIIRLTNGKFLILEVKGQDSLKNRAKREFLDEWVRAVNGHGEFGVWCWDVSWIPADVRDILAKHGG